MIIRNILILLHSLIRTSRLAFSAEVSYNLPNLLACAEWNPNGTTLAVESSLNLQPWNVFVDKNNTVYVTDSDSHRLYEWYNGSSNPPRIISNGLYKPYGLFVLSTGDIYVNDGDNGQVNKWKATTNSFETVAQFCQRCFAIFIDINDMLYCSMHDFHQVVRKPLQSNSNITTVVAGVGVAGSKAHMLYHPRGIFVNINLDLYVADCENNRIQLFRSGTVNGTTIAGTSDTIKLNKPSSVVLDANNHVYILDLGNNRIVAETSNGFDCIVACVEKADLSDKLYNPLSMAFDSFGNIYVTDSRNKRVRKFLLSNNKCDFTDDIKLTTKSTIATTTATTDVPVLSESVYTSVLTITTDSPTYLEECKTVFYENMQMLVSEEGRYDLILNSTVGIDVKLYENNFYSLNPVANLLLHSYEKTCSTSQIKFTTNLWPDNIYYLIVATTSLYAEASFSVVSTGPSRIIFNQANISKLLQTRYSSEFTPNSHKCALDVCRSLSSYCQIIKIHTTEAGYYTITIESDIDVFGYIYEKNFTLFDLTMNKLSINQVNCFPDPFTITVDRQMNTSFILVVATYEELDEGAFSIIVSGPNNFSIKCINDIEPIVQSNYSSELNNESQKFGHHNCRQLEYYYEALKLDVNTSGYYIFLNDNSLDIYGYLYQYPFDPYSSVDTSIAQSFVFCEDNQFKITAYLHSSITYVLVITTPYGDMNIQGPFSVIVKGPNRIDMKRMDDFQTTVVQSIYSSQLTENSPKYSRIYCQLPEFDYESIQINVIQSGVYTLSSISQGSLDGSLYEQHFDPYSSSERLLFYSKDNCAPSDFKITTELQSNITYILVVSTPFANWKGNFSILASGPNNITFNHIRLQTTYTSELTKETQGYPRVCGKGNYHYETSQVNVQQDGFYTFDSNTSILLYGYIYRNDFDPSYPNENLITQSKFSCRKYHFQLGVYLEVNTVHILVVTTFDPNVRGSFTLLVTGPNNITLNRINKKYSSCVVGDQCNLYTKSIGMTINDILRNQIQPNISFGKQSFLTKAIASITMIMFLTGLVNGIFSLMTFQDRELRKIGCGLYLLASSVTSLLTIIVFTAKFWFVVLTQLHSTVSSSVLRVDCIFLGPVLKLCLYLDGWLNACIAIERTVNVSKGVNFDRKMSRRTARWIIFILPILIMGTIVHEPIHHELFEYTTQKYKSPNSNLTLNKSIENEYEIEHNVLCVIRYSRSLQNYNTVTLFFHLVVPFLANLCSALFIIFGTARRRSAAQNNQTFKEHVLKQMSEHKQLLISPIILLILAMPRLIISLVSGCVDPSNNPWLYLCAYFISFTPSMLVFTIFVLPSELYRKTFKESMTRWRRQNRP